MTKHDKMRLINTTISSKKELLEYIKQAEATEKELENAKRLNFLLRGMIYYDDGFEVAFVIKEQLPNETYSQTWRRLMTEYNKLSKVGAK